jgi:hypothetical protein
MRACVSEIRSVCMGRLSGGIICSGRGREGDLTIQVQLSICMCFSHLYCCANSIVSLCRLAQRHEPDLRIASLTGTISAVSARSAIGTRRIRGSRAVPGNIPSHYARIAANYNGVRQTHGRQEFSRHSVRIRTRKTYLPE